MRSITARVLSFLAVHGTRISFSRFASSPNRDLRRYFHPKVFEVTGTDGCLLFLHFNSFQTGSMTATKLDIPCIWGGTLAGTLLKKRVTDSSASPQATTKIVGVHGWLDNLNSLLPLAEKLVDQHPSRSSNTNWTPHSSVLVTRLWDLSVRSSGTWILESSSKRFRLFQCA